MDQKSSPENVDTKMSNCKRQKTTTSSRRRGKEPVISTPVALSSDLPIAMRLPQETLCQIFSNLVEHPVHFTRVAQVCKSWKVAADTHLYWRHLTNKMDLPPPKPRAWKYKTYKSVVEREWRNQNFCSLCFRKSNSTERLGVQKVKTDSYEIAKICTSEDKCSDWYSIFNAEDESHEFCAFEKYFVEHPNALKNPITLIEENDNVSKENLDTKVVDHDDLIFGSSQLSDLSTMTSFSQDSSQSTTISDLSTDVPVNAPSTTNSDKSIPSSTKLPVPKFILRHILCRICNLRLNNKKIEREENDRRNLLSAKLGNHGLSIRSDSHLCNGFIEQGLGNPDKIVETMVEMNWFFKCTDYANLRYVRDDDGYISDDDWEDDMFFGRYDVPWRNLFEQRFISSRRVDSESGKRLALERWVEQRLSKGINTFPSEDPLSDQRPPPTLWEQINRIIDKKLNNSQGSSSSQQEGRKKKVRDSGNMLNIIDIDDEE